MPKLDNLTKLTKLTPDKRFRVKIIDQETRNKNSLKDNTYDASVKFWSPNYDEGPSVIMVWEYKEIPFKDLSDFNKKFSIEDNSLNGGTRRQKRTRRNRKSTRKS